MTKETLIKSVTKTANKAAFQLKKYSPEILAGVGTVGVVASTVLACKATTKASVVLESTKIMLDEVHETKALIDKELTDKEGNEISYTKKDYQKDLLIVYSQTAVQYAKLYAPAAILGVLSIGCLLTSNNILRKRNVALAAAYTAVDKGFKEYRGRVIERFGKEVDKELKYNVQPKEIEETTTDKKGKEKTVKKTENVACDKLGYSPYAAVFDESNINWQKNRDYNFTFLKAQQQYANDILEAKGYLFLNDVYDMLSMPKTKAGQTIGWLKDGPNSAGYVDFGMFDMTVEAKRDFIHGYEKSVILDFNVDGPILENAFEYAI